MQRRWIRLVIVLTIMTVMTTSVAGPAVEESVGQFERNLDIQNNPRADNKINNYIELTPEQKQKFLGLLEADTQPAPRDFRVYWKEGIRMESADKKFKLKFGGRLMGDIGWIGGSALESDLGIVLDDGVEFRRARLYVAGDFYEKLAFKLQFDFAGGDADLKDAYLKIKKLPLLGTLTLGHFKEPFSLEELTSSKYITFMERALPNVFVPGRNVGIMASNTALDKQMTWAIGAFRSTNDFGILVSDDSYSLTTRLTWLPWYEDKGRKVFHLGGSYSLVNPRNGVRIRQRPEAHWTLRLTDTGTFAEPDYMNLFGAEAALVCGPFSVQGEYIANAVDARTMVDDPYFYGWYAQASYFLTGEHRPYSKSSGTFSRVKPKKNWRQDGGWGAWELAGRFSYLDLDESGLPVTARRLQNITIGLNWYLNPNVRLMGNYIRSMVDGSDTDEDADIIMMRVQVDF